MRWCGVPLPPPTNNFRLSYPNKLYIVGKGIYPRVRIILNIGKNILISRFYEQFLRSSWILGHFWKFEKVPNSWNINISYIILKRVIWRFQIYNLFCEKFKFRGFTKAFKNFEKYIIAFIFAKFKYFGKQIIYIWDLQITRFKMIYDMFVF